MLIESLRLDGSTVHCRRAAVKADGERVAGSSAGRSAAGRWLTEGLDGRYTAAMPVNFDLPDTPHDKRAAMHTVPQVEPASARRARRPDPTVLTG